MELTSELDYLVWRHTKKIAFALHENTRKLPHETLSDGKYQLFCLIGTGKTVSQIADELAQRVETVSACRARILEKMHMENNVERIHYAVQNGQVN